MYVRDSNANTDVIFEVKKKKTVVLFPFRWGYNVCAYVCYMCKLGVFFCVLLIKCHSDSLLEY